MKAVSWFDPKDMPIGCAEVRLISVNLQTRGEGVLGDPVRTIYQLYTPEGRLVAEYDPYGEDDE